MKQWRCVHCKLVLDTEEEPEQCAECKCRTFAEIDQPRVRIKADIKFGNGQVIRCIGRVRDRQSVPWIDEADLRAHIARINEKNPEAGVEIVRVLTQ